MANPQTFYTAIGTAKETVFKTPVTPSRWHPAEIPRIVPHAYRHVLDEGLRGVASQDFDLLPGPGNSDFNWSGNVYADSTPFFLSLLMGSDAIAGVGPYTHTMALGAAPPSMTLEWQQNVQTYQMAGSRPAELNLNFNGRDGALTYGIQGQGALGTAISPTTKAFTVESAISAIAGWQGAITIAGGAPSGVLMEGAIVFQRPLKLIWGFTNSAGGSQDVQASYALALRVSGRLTFDFTAVTEYAYANTLAAITKNAVVITLRRSASEIIAITLSKAAWRMATIDAQDNTYTVVAEFNGIYNATDVGPCAIVVTNGVSAAYI